MLGAHLVFIWLMLGACLMDTWFVYLVHAWCALGAHFMYAWARK